MAQRGPKPTPTKVLALRGSWLAKRRPAEPLPHAEIPATPRDLDKDGRKIWRTLTTHLHAMQLLGRVDQHTLGRYIQLYQRWRLLQQDIETHGETAPVMKQRWVEAHYDAEGHLVPGQHETYHARTALRPQVQVWLALSDRLLRLEQQFGMTPSGRAAIGIQLAAASAMDPEWPVNPKRFLRLN